MPWPEPYIQNAMSCLLIKLVVLASFIDRFSWHLLSFFFGQIKGYLDRDWSCKEEVRPSPLELAVWSFQSFDGSAAAVLDLGIYSNTKDQTLRMSIYCPFWMINNTGLMLTYKVGPNCSFLPFFRWLITTRSLIAGDASADFAALFPCPSVAPLQRQSAKRRKQGGGATKGAHKLAKVSRKLRFVIIIYLRATK